MKHQNEKQSRTGKTNDPSLVTRRNFLKMGVGTLGAVVLLEFGGASMLFMKPRSLDGEFGGLVKAGPVESFPLGSVVEYPAGRFFLVRSNSGGFLAVYRRCTHLGCTVDWEQDQNRFFCPCHASSFDMQGDVENPPAPRALDTFPLQIEDGQVIVDTGHVQKRERFAPEQLAYE
jgi:cytochrome b6-f complex iron-sulfur subunit